MKKSKKFVLGILVAVFGMAVLSAKPFDIIKPIMPDENSAVIYFISLKTVGGYVWDGDKLIASFEEKGMPLMPILAYKTTPGEHYFIVNASNWITIKADLEPGKRYFLRIVTVPSPPFNKFLAVHPLGGDNGEEIVNYKASKIMTFTEKWKADFAKDKKGKKLIEEAKEKYQEAQSKPMDVDLPREYGI
jgi:hypothetical protein